MDVRVKQYEKQVILLFVPVSSLIIVISFEISCTASYQTGKSL